MKIPSKEIPQADELGVVAEVVVAVAAGATTYQEIAAAIGYVERQGRYYRLAAEILGLTRSVHSNTSALTPFGVQWVAASPADRQLMLAHAVLQCRIFQRVIPFIESKPQGVTRNQLLTFLQDVASLGAPSMAGRRVASVIHWLSEIGVIRQEGNRYLLNALPASVPFIDYSASEGEPLLPSAYGLSDYVDHERVAKERLGVSVVLVDQAKLERANHSHDALVRLVATKLKASGSIPKVGKVIDLAATVAGFGHYIFEMKSITATNSRSQIRAAISQLYEYRYIEQVPDAILVLVLESKLSAAEAWMHDYLITDRDVLILWSGDGNLYCPSALLPKLSFLNPIAI